jgi:UDP-N-acetylmuramoylalanine--D-glutamate ligase
VQHAKLKLKHNRINFAFATMMVESLGFRPDFQKALNLFTPAKYRMEYIGKYKGADVYNDSKSTNPSSLGTALDSIEGPTLLIIGGKLRGRDDFSLVKKFQKKLVKVLALGEARDEIFRQLSSEMVVEPIKDLSQLKQALENNQHQVDNILFAPSLPSYDLFKNFEQRGRAVEEMFRSMSGFEIG